MPRYYFDVRESDGLAVDVCGMDLSSKDSAWVEAARSAAEMARDKTHKIGACDHVTTIEVRDANGPIMKVTMTLETNASATNL